jgi:hypothetical protein
MPSAQMAQAMVAMVVERLAQPALPAREVLFQPRLIERQSVASPTPAAASASARTRARSPRKSQA